MSASDRIIVGSVSIRAIRCGDPRPLSLSLPWIRSRLWFSTNIGGTSYWVNQHSLRKRATFQACAQHSSLDRLLSDSGHNRHRDEINKTFAQLFGPDEHILRSWWNRPNMTPYGIRMALNGLRLNKPSTRDRVIQVAQAVRECNPRISFEDFRNMVVAAHRASLEIARGKRKKNTYSSRSLIKCEDGMLVAVLSRHTEGDPPPSGGNFKTVVKGVNMRTGAVVAISRQYLSEAGPLHQLALDESRLALHLPHIANVVPTHAVLLRTSTARNAKPARVLTPMRLLQVMPWFPSNLLQQIQRHCLSPLSQIQIATDVASGLANLHASGLIHGDIKPQNVLVTDNNHAYIGDFGFSCRVGQRIKGQTPTYSSPELVRQADNLCAETGQDTWAFGVLLFELYTGFIPNWIHAGRNFINSYDESQVRRELQQNILLPPEIRALLCDIFRFIPALRPSMQEIYQRLLTLQAAPPTALPAAPAALPVVPAAPAAATSPPPTAPTALPAVAPAAPLAGATIPIAAAHDDERTSLSPTDSTSDCSNTSLSWITGTSSIDDNPPSPQRPRRQTL
jgi:serine/threonine protein kinase